MGLGTRRRVRRQWFDLKARAAKNRLPRCSTVGILPPVYTTHRLSYPLSLVHMRQSLKTEQCHLCILTKTYPMCFWGVFCVSMQCSQLFSTPHLILKPATQNKAFGDTMLSNYIQYRSSMPLMEPPPNPEDRVSLFKCGLGFRNKITFIFP